MKNAYLIILFLSFFLAVSCNRKAKVPISVDIVEQSDQTFSISYFENIGGLSRNQLINILYNNAVSQKDQEKFRYLENLFNQYSPIDLFEAHRLIQTKFLDGDWEISGEQINKDIKIKEGLIIPDSTKVYIVNNKAQMLIDHQLIEFEWAGNEFKSLYNGELITMKKKS